MNNSFSQFGVRFSNIELLRIIAMIMVLGLHANYLVFGGTSIIEYSSSWLMNFLRCLGEGLCIIAVNIFVLISGWFKIKFSLEKYAKLISQCVLLSVFVYVICCIGGSVDFSLRGLMTGSMKWLRIWFIPSYLGLMMLAPVINHFFDSSNKKSVIAFVCSIFILELVGWITPQYNWGLNRGYSTIHLIIIYSFGRFLRINEKFFLEIKNREYALLFVFSLLGYFLINIMQSRYNFRGGENDYCSPFVILQSISFFMIFAKWNRQWNSKVVNNVAKLSFSVLVIHLNDYMFPYFLLSVRRISDISDSYALNIFYIGVFVIGVFLLCIFMDLLRLVLVNGIKSLILCSVITTRSRSLLKKNNSLEI